ncbi:MAG TPA: C1 family peptidase [Methylomusa anaerophila]|uniref:Papain family cysteine protease n=1 Tax=Methylomusa anaerophila TaxID=1930071 RepID=A0A348AGE0_9FIRM|nr:C1 family peptidase [Methylomusa anaerophila]BBB90138.1 papain family cysteine protease [Methylomusa anaerophila]HML88138.1 C1 family peptidase [Methylomusa anaerophila]
MYQKVILPNSKKILGTGWLPPLPDLRDYSEEHEQIKSIVEKLGIPMGRADSLPDKADLRQWCTAIEDQGELGSCTANAAAGIVEYFINKAYQKQINVSRLFIYKATRNLMGVTGDAGAYLRDTMGSLVLLGAPAEKYWPYTDINPDFDKEPTSFVYSLADNYEALQYFTHDGVGTTNKTPAEVLNSIKKYIAAGIPAMFGFYGFSSYTQADVKGGIPYPGPDERAQWGHAVVAVGYDDSLKIKNLQYNLETTGAILIRNSWGASWGDNGYGWLPYDYVLNQLATDFWSLIKMEWIDTDQFGPVSI